MTIPLYAMMNEFAPLSSGKVADEASPAASQEVSHGQQDEASNEESGPHGSLFEQCIPQVGKSTGKASEGDSATASEGARQDLAKRVQLTADVPDLKISALAEGSLTDGYKLHEVAFFDSAILDMTTTKSTNVADVESKNFAQSSPVQTNVVPNLELDYSADVAA